MLGLLLVNSMVCYGFRFATSDGQALNFIRISFEWVGQKLGIDDTMEVIVKPIYGCVNCMASIWGLIGVYLFGDRIGIELISLQTIGYILALCGINFITGLVIAWMAEPRQSFRGNG